MSLKKEYLKDVRDLTAYRKALLFRKGMYSILDRLPSSNEFMKADIRKASCALCSNLAEGNGNYYYEREFHHYDIGLCKLAKCQSYLHLLFGLETITEQVYKKLQELALEIKRMVIRLMEEVEELPINEVEPNKIYPFEQSLNVINSDSAIYQEVRLFQGNIRNMVKKVPFEIEHDNLIDQIIRSSNSIYENLLRTKNISSPGEIYYYLNIGIASTVETNSWLDISVMENYISKEEYVLLDNESRKIQKKMIQMINQINKQPTPL
ncbi:four helix bundle protein [Bacillus sp. HNG]|uniref:four helix bundle protein n=1 Tax=Bacillus sp. HNG TaxID=2293325 RepID=UPI000E2F7EB3|nr:four helix bundle protein [Bacillus sp. HNG]RFB12730.1 four helix bundle protein [Bacillus sp. HNG]